MFLSARKCMMLMLGAALLLPQAAVAAPEPFDIQVLVSLTGPGAFLGAGEQKTLQAVQKIVNKQGGIHGRPVRFVMQDDQSSPQIAVQLMNGIIASKVPVMLGSSYAAPCFALAPLVKANGPVEWCFANTVHPPPGSFVFSSGISTKDLAAAGLRYYRTRGLKKIGVIVTTDATGQDGEAILKEGLTLPENKDMSIVGIEHYNTSDLSVTAQLERLRADGAQAIIAWVTGTPLATVLHGYSDAGLDMPLMTNAGNINNIQMSGLANIIPKDLTFTGYRFEGHNAIGPGPVRQMQNEFIDALKAEGISPPDVTYSYAWDSAFIVVDALRHLPLDATPVQVRDFIENFHSYAGINGIMDFRDGSQRGITGSATLMVKYDPKTRGWIPVSKPGGAAL